MLLQLLVAVTTVIAPCPTAACEVAKQSFGHLTIVPKLGPTESSSTVAPSDSLTHCLQLCALNRLRNSCRSVCWLPSGQCLMYSVGGESYSYQPADCEITKLYRTDEYPDCRVRWVGTRRFCVVQQRLSGSVNFSRPWLDYENGFGDTDNFWTGLKLLHRLTNSGDTGSNGAGATVRFEMTKWNGFEYHCEYDGFQVGNTTSNYLLNYTRYAIERSNISTDGLAERGRGMMFSTMDRDNDIRSDSCSINYASGAGWWFASCFYTNPNGRFVNSEIYSHQYVTWYAIDNAFISLKSIRMMILVE